MTHRIVKGQIASAVADAATFTASYPTGANGGTFYLAMGHVLILGGNKYEFPVDFDLTFGTSNITVTNKSGASWPAESNFILQLEEPGERVFRSIRDRNKSAILPVSPPPLMANMIRGNVSFINLGAPDAPAGDNILDGVSATDSAQTYDTDDFELQPDVPRTLQMVGSSGADHVVTVTGKDVYDQVMVEQFTLSGTTVQYGKKAFKSLTTIAVAAGAASDTMDVGYGNQLGLPAFLPSAGHVVGVMQDGVLLPAKEILGPVYIDQTGLLAGTSYWAYNEHAGLVERASTIVRTAVTTGGNITFEISTAAVTGLTVVVADAAAAGDIDTDVPTDTLGNDSTRLLPARTGIEIIPAAAFDTAGALDASVIVNTQGIFQAGLRAANGSTATTADVRGTFRPPVDPDGSINFQLAVCLPDPGFIGISQYAG